MAEAVVEKVAEAVVGGLIGIVVEIRTELWFVLVQGSMDLLQWNLWLIVIVEFRTYVKILQP